GEERFRCGGLVGALAVDLIAGIGVSHLGGVVAAQGKGMGRINGTKAGGGGGNRKKEEGAGEPPGPAFFSARRCKPPRRRDRCGRPACRPIRQKGSARSCRR